MRKFHFIFFIIFAISACQKQVDHTSEILALKNSITTLQKKYDSLANALANTNLNITMMNSNILSIRTQVSSMFDQITVLNNAVSNVNINISNVNLQISNLSKGLLAVQSTVLDLQKKYDSLSSSLLTVNTNLVSINNSVNVIVTQIITIQTQIINLQTVLSSNSNDIVEINKQLTTLNQYYLALFDKLNGLLAQLSSSPSTIQTGLIAYYPFNGNAGDSSGNGNHGTVINTLSYTSDHSLRPNSALNLGSGRITTNTRVFNFLQTDIFSISFWVMIDDNSSGGRLLSTENPEGNFRIASYGNGSYAFQFGGQPYLYDTIPLNKWYYITYVYSNRSISFYKNGVLKTTAINSTVEVLNYGTPFTIGAKAASAYDTWKGKIDELRIYNRVLSSDEIQYLYTH